MNRFERGCRGMVWALSASAALAGPTGALAQSGELVAVVAANSKAPPKLSADELGAIFMGTAKSFPNGERAVPIDQKSGTRPYASFYQLSSGKTEAQIKAYWARILFTGKGQPPQDGGDSAAVKKLVAANPNMVGYIEPALVDGSVRVITELK